MFFTFLTYECVWFNVENCKYYKAIAKIVTFRD